MSGRHRKVPLIMRVPTGVREQPAWIFIGILVFMGGLGYLTGQSTSAVTEAIGHNGLRIWGVVLMVTGALLNVATALARPSLEKLALRILSCAMFAYTGWVLVVVPLDRTTPTVILAGSLIALAEFRVWHLRTLIKRTEIIRHELERRGHNE